MHFNPTIIFTASLCYLENKPEKHLFIFSSTSSEQTMVFKEHNEHLEALCKIPDFKILFRKTTELKELRSKR